MSSGNGGGTGGGRTVSPRRDAVRNRDALLAAARGLFAERGLDVPFDDVARRAGLGSATLYQHTTASAHRSTAPRRSPR
ncbi:helix-turn-helix domain-containing protein [Streptomyces sp. NPDC059816]|uniref:helix-turn-helix domain-containing protein n=1 Tax=Streptomyces sp. NPDC059816 TaxID=3346960 RepID=UPI00364EDCE4